MLYTMENVEQALNITPTADKLIIVLNISLSAARIADE